jgi:hypothetical protein
VPLTLRWTRDAMSAVGKKLHHYVPRFYLRAWAVQDRLYCLQGGEILDPNIRNVGAENRAVFLLGASGVTRRKD